MPLNLVPNDGRLDLPAVEIVALTRGAGSQWPDPIIIDYLNTRLVAQQVATVIDQDFGTMALQDADNVNITGGSITGVTLVIADIEISGSIILKGTIYDYTIEWADPSGDWVLDIPDTGANDTFVFANLAQTLVNKTMDGDDNNFVDIHTDSLKDRTGVDTDVVTGIAGTDGNLGMWNADGDMVDSTIPASDITDLYGFEYVTVTDETTDLTNSRVLTAGTDISIDTATPGQIIINSTSGAGTVTSFSAGDLSPVFTTNVADPTTTPALTFSLTNAAANTWLGNNTASPAGPAYNAAGDLTKTDDTNVTLTLGGTPTDSLLNAVSLTLGWTGQLALTRGGTGANLSDPGANRLWGWDDTDNSIGFWTIGTGLSYDHASHTLSSDGGITPAALTRVDDTNVTLTLGGTPSTALLQATSLTVGWTGTLATARGGTGRGSATEYAVICGGTTTTGAHQSIAGVGTSGQVLTSNGAGMLPTFEDATGGIPTEITVATEAADTTCYPAFFTGQTGDLGPKTRPTTTLNAATGEFSTDIITVTASPGFNLRDSSAAQNVTFSMSSSPALTANRVMEFNLANANRVLTFAGNATISGTNSGDVTLAGTPDYITISGQVITRNQIDLTTDVTGDLPYANLTQAGAASRLLGRGSAAGGGDWQDISLGTGLSMSGTTLSSDGGVTPAALTRVDDSNVTMTLGGSPTVALLAATSLTLGWTGTLAVARGGTGLSETVAFSARAASGQLNVTGAGTVYTVQFTTEIYDTGGDYNAGTGTFTASVDGAYLFITAVRNSNGSITAAADTSRVNVVTSNLTYFNAFSWTNTLDYDDRTQMCMAIAEMDAGDTAIVQFTVTGEAGDTVDIDGNATVATTYFQGQLLSPL
jgi:hypothetical protein